MTKHAKLLSSLIYAATGLMYICIVRDVLVNPHNPDFDYKSRLLLALISVAVAGLMICSFIVSKIPYKKLMFFAGIVLLSFMQVVVICYLSVRYDVESWDMGVVYNAAKYYVDNRTFDMTKYDYFLWFPNNSPLYNVFIVLFCIFAVFGISHTQLALNIFNGFLLLIAAVFTERAAAVLSGREYSVLGLAFCILLTPFSLYTAIAYTDTFSIVFLAAALYFYVCAIKERGNYWLNIAAFAVMVAVGASFKVSVIILAIAALIDICFKHTHRRRTILSLAMVCVISFGGFAGLKYVHEHSPFLPDYDYNYTIPHSHWVMMGLNGLGGYNDDDYQLITLVHPDKASRQQANIAEIINRVRQKGVKGMVYHVANKISYIYSDGTFGACYKLDRSAVRGSALHRYVVYLGDKFYYLGYSSLAIFLSMLIIIAVGLLTAARKKDNSAVMPALSLIGVTAFLILWEARARYILNFLPIFVLLTVFGIKQFSLWVKTKYEK